ncbi:hypothetical protein J1614_012005 [Plenodomus biglobosus]|nr:hypothetical protein J1614_012005 [Plenodomus biglobosus]
MKMLPTLTTLALSTTRIQAAIIPQEDAKIPAGTQSSHIDLVYTTEYRTVYAQPGPTAGPPAPAPTPTPTPAPPYAQNLTRTSVVTVMTTLNTTTSSSIYRAPPGQRCGRLKSSSLAGTGGYNSPAPSDHLQYGPGVPGPATSANGTLNLSNLPKFSYAPWESSSTSQGIATGSLVEGHASSAIIPPPTSTIVLVPVKTTAIVVVPIHPSSTALVVVPTQPPIVARIMSAAHWERGVKPKFNSEILDAVETMIPGGVVHMLPRAGPNIVDTIIQHGIWESHTHDAHSLKDGEYGATTPNNLGAFGRVPEKQSPAAPQDMAVSPTLTTTCKDNGEKGEEEDDEEDTTQTSKTTITTIKSLKRSSSSATLTTTTTTSTTSTKLTKPTSNPTPTPKPRPPPSPSPSTQPPTPNLHTSILHTSILHTSILHPDPRCPYPYPDIYCGPRKTTLITVTKPPASSASGSAAMAPSSKGGKEKKEKETKKETKSKAWCPYPGQEC